jgi:AcrR family transcriptional regulator
MTSRVALEELRSASICDAALRLLSTKGFAGIRVQDIADEAGVSKGTIYLYFKSLEEILEKTFETVVEGLFVRLRREMAAVTSFPEGIEVVARAHMEYFSERQDFFRVFLSMAEPLGEKRLRGFRSYARYVGQLLPLLEAAQSRGELRLTDTTRTAIAITAVLRDLVLQRLSEESPRPLDQDVAFAREMICGGMVRA